MNVWRLRIELINDFHTSGVKTGSTIDVLRERYIQDDRPKERYIIPATHIKGVMRSEAKRIWGKREEIFRLFGPEEQEGKEFYEEPILKFTDARAKKAQVAERARVRIDRNTGSHAERGLFSEKVICSGSVFVGFILSGHQLNEEEERILKGSLTSASHYGLGKSRSSGLGQVKIELQPSSVQEVIKEMMR